MADAKYLGSGATLDCPAVAVTDEVCSVAGGAGWSGAYRVVMLGFSSL
jgi:hypothetical protein